MWQQEAKRRCGAMAMEEESAFGIFVMTVTYRPGNEVAV
jgi:hypothetical protein